jgi:hypothetical protein
LISNWRICAEKHSQNGVSNGWPLGIEDRLPAHGPCLAEAFYAVDSPGEHAFKAANLA